MPVHPSEEEAPSHIFDQVAKDSKDSTASDHAIHDTKQAKEAVGNDPHKSKGPQIPEKMPEAAGKDELKAKAQELNKSRTHGAGTEE